MRVLHVFKSYYPDSFGGVERTIRVIAKGALAHSIRSDVLSLSRNPLANTMEIDGHLAQKAKLSFELASTGFSIDAISKFAMLSSRADIIHYHFPWPFMDLMHILCSPRKPIVITYHSDIVKQNFLLKFYKPLMHRFLRKADMIVATSHNYANSSLVLRQYIDKIKIIPTGLEKEDYPKASQTLIKSWKARFPKPFFLFVGVLRYYKGLHTLIEAAKNVDADILIAGGGPMAGQLQAQVALARLTNVHFLGVISEPDKAALLELCTAFVFPSHLRSEAYGLSLVEAAMFGKPMISCEIGTGTSYVNRDGETGIVVPPENPGALSSAMITVQQNQHLAATFSANALVRYDDELKAAMTAESYCQLYRSL